MPSISEFFGITIYMYYALGYHKTPYFHARYQGSDASFAIESGHVFAGHLPPKVVGLIQDWAKRHNRKVFIRNGILTWPTGYDIDPYHLVAQGHLVNKTA